MPSNFKTDLDAKARIEVYHKVRQAIKKDFQSSYQSQINDGYDKYNLQQTLWQEFNKQINAVVHTQIRNVLYRQLMNI